MFFLICIFFVFSLWIYSLLKTPVYFSPGKMVTDKSGTYIYVALTTNKAVAVVDFHTKRICETISLYQNPTELAISADGKLLYVSMGEVEGSIAVVDLQKREVIASIPVGHTPEGILLSRDEKTLFVANRFSNTLSVIDLELNKIVETISTIREPRSLLISPDGQTLVVANYLPVQSSTDSIIASEIILLDLSTRIIREILLMENGSQSALGLACSSDGKYLYITHLLSRYHIPLTQLDRGWMNTNALTIVDLQKGVIYATLLLDDIDRGAANPAGLYIDKQDNLYVALSGTHELMILKMRELHNKLALLFAKTESNQIDCLRENLSTSLNFTKPFKTRIHLQGKSPRYVIGVTDKIVVSSHFSPLLEIYDKDGIFSDIITLGKESELNHIRKGELAFCDARLCYQGWQSCISCHPDGRMDGLSWDQMNDGIGNPKSTKSMLFSHVTPPTMITGIRPSAEVAVRKGIIHILNSQIDEAVACDMDAYLRSLKPVISPFLALYEKKDPEHKGEILFKEAHCASCHHGAYYTDGKSYSVGIGAGNDELSSFDVPTLREVWRTSPYLYDGRAKTIREVLTVCNQHDQHGITQNLTEEELERLELYVLTL